MLILLNNRAYKNKTGGFKVSIRRNVFAFLGATFVLAWLIAVVPQVSAQQNGSGLQLSPTRTELSGNPGEQKNFTISLKNITQGPLSAQVSLNDFESDNSTGTPKILVDTNNRTPYTLSKMVKGLRNIDLAAGETKEIKGTIDIPANASPGAYFGAVRYAIVPQGASSDERQIALNASVAHLLLVEVPGDVVQQIQIQSLLMQRNGEAGKFFVNKPDKAALAVKNLGNGFSRPFGKVTITSGFGKQVYSYDVNNTDPRSIVLPNSSRTYTDEVGSITLPGKYTATASVAYGNGAEVVTYKSAFWYLPLWFIIALIVLIFAALVVSYTIYRKRSHKKSLRSN